MTPTQAALSRTTALTSAALMIALATPGQAQEVFDLDAITVTANREETEVDRSGSTVEIVTEEELRAAGSVPVAEYLNRLPGVTFSSNGGLGKTTTLRIRGAGGAYIGVYIDGIDVNDASNTDIQFDFASLTTADICRIEVLKGAQSALYGSEAIAGVINITTNTATEPGLHHRYNLEVGSYNTAKLAFNSAYMTERGKFAATIAHIRTDGWSAADENDGNTEADGHEATRLSFSGEYDLTDTLTIGAAGFFQTSLSDYDESGPVDGTPDEESYADEYALRAFARFETGAVQHEVAASYYVIDRGVKGTNGWGPFEYPYMGERKTLAYIGRAPIAPTVDLAFGADATREIYTGSSDSVDHDIYGVYVEGNWTPNDSFDLVASLRHDDHSSFGGKTTGRLAGAWRPSEDLILRFAAGTGFRTPSLYQLFDGWSGNPDLQPETSASYEMGVEKRFGDSAFVKATLFYTEITDLIQYAGGAYRQVPGTSTMQGLELSTGWELSGTMRLTANYTFTDTEDASGARLVRVPRHEVNIGLDADLTDRLTTSVSLTHAEDTEAYGGGKLGDYTLVNATLGYDLNDSTTAYLRVENLFDEEYQTAKGYGTSDRAFYFGLRGRF
ncbi:TonB-dependent receptor plug domain-containing protein [Pseudooceanicola sp. 200-1SW]|uniref:TonB-dependent receptor plug domain-containing protein n=1 Tax=Pseudooceanicola sp. 200-1SW TaxID=3425949 RepID=UPI003D7F58FB